MTKTQKLYNIFLSGTDLLQDTDEDAICIGTMLPAYSPAGIEKIMIYHTRLIDELLAFTSRSILYTVQLLSMRGCTYHEYQTVLFDLTIPPKDFARYPVLRCLFFNSQKERKEKVIYRYKRDSHDDYLNLLAQMLQKTHPSLFSFVFKDES